MTDHPLTETEAADLARIILDDSEGEHPDDMYTLSVREARTLAHAVVNVARLARAEEYRANQEAIEGAWGGASMHFGFAGDLRAALNGETDG